MDHSRHLRQILDLASSPITSPPSSPLSLKTKKLSVSSGTSAIILSGSPRRIPSLNTPPLTPSSSFNSHGDGTDFTPSTPEPSSPVGWSPHTTGKIRSDVTGLQGYLTPSSIRSRSLSSCEDGVESAASAIMSLVLNSPTKGITPKRDKLFKHVVGGHSVSTEAIEIIDHCFRNRADVKLSRFVLVR